jgi:putative SOS response-associated peptidase YedK
MISFNRPKYCSSIETYSTVKESSTYFFIYTQTKEEALALVNKWNRPESGWLYSILSITTNPGPFVEELYEKYPSEDTVIGKVTHWRDRA